MRKPLRLLFLLLAMVWFSSCVLKKETIMFQDLQAQDITTSDSTDSMINTVVIQPGDLLDIKVTTTEKAMEQMTQSQNSGTNIGGSVNTSLNNYITNFLVDNKGNVTLPLVKDVFVKGLTIKQARQRIATVMKAYMQDPYVDIKFLTFKVSIMGETLRPGQITISNEHANILDALAQSGGVTDVANISNIKVIRGDLKHPKVYKIDLTQKAYFNSPGFSLQPNDVIYIQPLDRKFVFANLNEALPFLAVLNSVFLAVNIVNLINNIKK